MAKEGRDPFKQKHKSNKVKIYTTPLIEEFEIENYEDTPSDVTRENISEYYRSTQVNV